MRSSQALRRDELASVGADLAHYWREGYAVVRGFCGAAEIAEIRTAADQLYREGVAHGRSFRHGNLFYNIAREREGSEALVRMVQWPSYHQPVMNAVRLVGLSASGAIDLELEPGDLALRCPYLVHGSGTNRSNHRRRFYINGYVRAADCDRGEWAFRQGRSVPFCPKPALVHFEELYERPGPHYTD